MMSAFMFPIYLATNKTQNQRKEIKKEGTTEDREAWYQERPVLGPNRPERGKTNSWQLTDK